MPLGPKRAPGRYEVPVSKGAPILLLERKLPPYAERDCTNERNVELRVAFEAWVVWQATECGDSGEDGVGLYRGQMLLQSFN
jgi:hypothetical protein